jgi:RNA polymerase sigma factor (sigma-70 family)
LARQHEFEQDSIPGCVFAADPGVQYFMDAQHADPLAPVQKRDAGLRSPSLERARGGDVEAFRHLMRAYQARVFSIAFRFTGSRPDAEELLQDVFLQLHGALNQICDDEHLRKWLLRTVAHRCIDRLRHDGRRPTLVPVETMPPLAEPTMDEGAADPLASKRLRELLLGLAPHARAVVLLRFQEDLDLAEIATVLAIPLSTVKSHLSRSLERMRAQLEVENHGS